ncbi:SRPBCC family protein [Streptomyces sp. NPDC050504]|uniref:SRPBCC family protein n=1 Tax=Streptomyces sp. NPDC050504 TaxID=3365618 RepID=UPI0037B16D3F
MTEVRFTATCDAPLDITFEYLDDYRNVTEYWHGMESYRPAGALDHGPGSMYEAVSKIGPSTLKSTIETVEWEKNTRIAYKSVAGMDSSTTFDFAAVDAAHSTVEFRIEFRLPGGIAGRAIEKSLEPFVATAARNTAANISKRVAEYYETVRADARRRAADLPDK